MAKHARPSENREAVPSWLRKEYLSWSGECSPGGHGECDGSDGRCECPCHVTDDLDVVYGNMKTVEKWHAELHREKPLNPNRTSHRRTCYACRITNGCNGDKVIATLCPYQKEK